jgi:hypothetical protein
MSRFLKARTLLRRARDAAVGTPVPQPDEGPWCARGSSRRRWRSEPEPDQTGAVKVFLRRVGGPWGDVP